MLQNIASSVVQSQKLKKQQQSNSSSEFTTRRLMNYSDLLEGFVRVPCAVHLAHEHATSLAAIGHVAIVDPGILSEALVLQRGPLSVGCMT